MKVCSGDGKNFRRVEASNSVWMGFEMYSFMPFARHFSRWPGRALAVTAIIGISEIFEGSARMAFVASNPSIPGI